MIFVEKLYVQKDVPIVLEEEIDVQKGESAE